MTALLKDSVHSLGVKAHFSLPSHLQKTALTYGLRVENQGNGSYRLLAHSGDVDLAAIVPSFVDHQGDSFDLENIKKLLEYLHQPLRMSVQADHGERTTLHRALRFATTGSVEIPVDKEEELEKETAECHAETEQAMRDEDVWRQHMELGNAQEAQSSVPATSFDPAQGFTFDFDDSFVVADGFAAPNQKAMQGKLRDLIGRATKGRYGDDKSSSVTLSATELEMFCKLARQADLSPLIDKVEFEEAVQEKIASIQKRTFKLSRDRAFVRLTKEQNVDGQTKLKQLMEATSALTPLIHSQDMRDIWTHYHFTERNNSPIEALGKEYGVFLATMDAMAQQTAVSPAQMEAVAQEFYSLLAFSEKLSGALQESKSEHAAKLREGFSQASVTGVSAVDKLLDGEHQDVLAVLEKALGQGGGAAGQLAAATVDTTLDFTMDVVNFIKESPAVATTFVALATTLYIANGGDAEAAQIAQAANDSMDTVFTFGDEGLEEIAIDAASLPEEAKQTQNWHWDMGPLGLYKHYMYDNAVVGPAQTVMDWMRMGVQSGYDAVGLPVNPEPAFSASAEKTVTPLADQLFKINLFQNASHAAFWMYMTAKGFNHGFKGANRIFELLSPLTNLGAQAIKPRALNGVSDRLMALVDQSAEFDGMRYEADIQWPKHMEHACKKAGKPCVAHKLAEAAQARVELESVLPDDIIEAQGAVKLGGLRHQFTISANNLQPMMTALDSFDVAAKHLAAQIGMGDEWYQAFIAERIERITKALRRYQDDANKDALSAALDESLESVIGAQVKYSGASPLYEVLFGEEVGGQVSKNLRRSANAEFGNLKRSDRQGRYKEAANDSGTLTGYSYAQSVLVANTMWGGCVKAARVAGKAGRSVVNKKTAIAGAGLAAVAVALDMAGAGNEFTDQVSANVGTIASGAVTATTFLFYNFWEDVLGVHVGSGAALLAAGAVAGYAYKKAVRPLSLTGIELGREKCGIDLSGTWSATKSAGESAMLMLKGGVSRVNRRLGQKVSGKQRLPSDHAAHQSQPYEP